MQQQLNGSLNPCGARQPAKIGASPIQFTLQRPDAGVQCLRGAIDRHAAGENLDPHLLHDDLEQIPWSAALPVSRHILDGDNWPRSGPWSSAKMMAIHDDA